MPRLPSIPYEVLHRLYVVEGQLVTDIAERYTVSASTIRGLLARHGMAKRRGTGVRPKRCETVVTPPSIPPPIKPPVMKAAPNRPALHPVVATGGSYRALCDYAERAGISYTQALQAWHKERARGA